MKHPVKVTITYCAECGYDVQAAALVAEIMRVCQHEFSSIELIPWYEGAFEVAVDGCLVHSMYRDGGFPNHAEVIDAIRGPSSTTE